MFSFLGPESPPVQLYGKLPLAKDYLRIGAAQHTGGLLKSWLDSEFSGTAGTESPAFARPMRWILGEGWGVPLMGAIWPSSDAGGLRKFPFVAFVERRRKPLTEDLLRGFACGAGIWNKLDGLYRAHENYTDGQSFLAAMRGQAIDIATVADEPLERITLSTWLESMWPDGEAGLLEAMRELASIRDSKPASVLRLPLVSNLSMRAQAHVWWHVVKELGLFEANSVPALFLPFEDSPGDAPAFMLVFRRPLAARDSAWFSGAAMSQAATPGDLLDGRPRVAVAITPAHENTPVLSESLRGTLATFRGRYRR